MTKTGKRGVTLLLLLSLCAALLCLAPVPALAETVLERATVSLTFEPVALMELSNVKAAASGTGYSLASATWYDSNGKAETVQFKKGSYRLEVVLKAGDGYSFGPGVKGYISNSDSGVSVSRSEDGKTLTLTKSYTTAIWGPVLIKSPGPESIQAGEWTSFVASGLYVDRYEWFLQSPEGNTNLAMDQLGAQFPGMSQDGDGTSKLKLYNVPASVNGWKIWCRLWAVDKISSVSSNTALIQVAGATPTPEPSPEPTPEPEAEASPAPEEGETPEEEEEEPYVPPHRFAEEWSYDEQRHWHVCLDEDCDQVSDRFAHRIDWQYNAQSGQEEGVCSVCGYAGARAPETDEGLQAAAESRDLSTFRTVLLALGGLLALSILILIIQAIRAAAYRRR